MLFICFKSTRKSPYRRLIINVDVSEVSGFMHKIVYQPNRQQTALLAGFIAHSVSIYD